MYRDNDFSDILLDETLYKEKFENILIYDISYETSTGPKPLRTRFDKIEEFIEIHDQIKYLLLFDYRYCDKICDNIKYLISETSETDIILEESKLIHMILCLLKKY